jgi:hypothetical protein
VPSLADVKVTPAKPKESSKPGTEKKKQTGSQPAGESKSEEQVDGATTLAQAIKLHDQGLTQQAITAAQQAIVLFDEEVKAGKNAAVARRGTENAKKMIGIWQSAESENKQP